MKIKQIPNLEKINLLHCQNGILHEIVKEYPGKTIENIIFQIESRIDELMNQVK